MNICWRLNKYKSTKAYLAAVGAIEAILVVGSFLW